MTTFAEQVDDDLDGIYEDASGPAHSITITPKGSAATSVLAISSGTTFERVENGEGSYGIARKTEMVRLSQLGSISIEQISGASVSSDGSTWQVESIGAYGYGSVVLNIVRDYAEGKHGEGFKKKL